mmetsp:Transcript_10554/g.29141  ORF Transcript_10554/g.29141 Transcript_10554/m.29141 type:complete len:260 (+) Transcript_10554:312-1091(+)
MEAHIERHLVVADFELRMLQDQVAYGSHGVGCGIESTRVHNGFINDIAFELLECPAVLQMIPVPSDRRRSSFGNPCPNVGKQNQVGRWMCIGVVDTGSFFLNGIKNVLLLMTANNGIPQRFPIKRIGLKFGIPKINGQAPIVRTTLATRIVDKVKSKSIKVFPRPSLARFLHLHSMSSQKALNPPRCLVTNHHFDFARVMPTQATDKSSIVTQIFVTHGARNDHGSKWPLLPGRRGTSLHAPIVSYQLVMCVLVVDVRQ